VARVRLVLPDAADIKRLVDDEGRIAVRVTPGARIESLELVVEEFEEAGLLERPIEFLKRGTPGLPKGSC